MIDYREAILNDLNTLRINRKNRTVAIDKAYKLTEEILTTRFNKENIQDSNEEGIYTVFKINQDLNHLKTFIEDFLLLDTMNNISSSTYIVRSRKYNEVRVFKLEVQSEMREILFKLLAKLYNHE